MSKLTITGGVRLHGKVRVSGAKNSVLKLMAASILGGTPSRICNVPRISDVSVMAETLRSLGAAVEESGDVLTIDPAGVCAVEPPDDLIRRMRAGIQLMGPLLARFGKARVPQPGGCEIGSRPIDLHLKGLSMMGAHIREEHGFIVAEAGRLKGCEILLDFPSVGATENIMTAAVLAEGTTVIKNAAREPEIVDLQNFLNMMGASIVGAGTDVIKIRGVDALGGTSYRTISDRIEAATYMAAACITRGDVEVTDVVPAHLDSVVAKLLEMGAEVEVLDTSIRVRMESRPRAVSIRSLPYPGFPTDAQPQLGAVMSVASGTSIIVETVFSNRFRYVDEIKRMGADIRIEGRTAIIGGVPALSGAKVKAEDLRGGAALVLAGLAADGVTELEGAHHIDRGYEAIEDKLSALGAMITRESG